MTPVCKHCQGTHRSNHCPATPRTRPHCRYCKSLTHQGNHCPERPRPEVPPGSVTPEGNYSEENYERDVLLSDIGALERALVKAHPEHEGEISRRCADLRNIVRKAKP